MAGLDDTKPGPQAAREVPTDSDVDSFSARLGGELGDLREPEDDLLLDVRRRELASKLFGGHVASVKIGRFTVVRKLGVGGMGIVYMAYDEQLDRRVAVKLLRSSTSSEARLRFEREAQAMARLSHPNVVAVHEVGTHEGETFVAMEFVDGQDLRAWMSAEPRTWSAIVAAFRQAGEGLVAAHEAGVVHRDFKPDNVLVGNDGRVRVADFGLAHGFGEALELTHGVPEDSQRRLEIELTRTGALMGTPAYMPPEQYAGRRTDARGDQFSFCVALWEALYGQRPFVGKTLLELSTVIHAGRIDPPPIDNEVPGWLRAILVRGLARDPQDRWPSMRALLDASGADPRVRQRRIVTRVALTVGGLALIGALYLASSELGHSARARYWTLLTEDLLEIERERGFEQANDEAIRARDASRMLVVRNHLPTALRTQREDPAVAAAYLREVEGDERHGSAWLSAANEVLGRPLSARVLRGHRAPVAPLLFSPDGAWLYSGSDDGEVRRWQLETGSSEIIVTHEGIITELALSPDGRWLASSSMDGTVRLWSSTTGQLRVLARHAKAVWSVVFDRSGRRLATASSDGTVQVHELQSERVHELDIGAVVRAVDFDPSGTRLLIGSEDAAARVWRIGDAQPTFVLEGHTQPVFHVRWVSEQQAITAADDGSARLWQLDGEQPASRVVAVHEQAIAAIDVIELIDVHGSRLVSGAIDGSMRVSSLEPPYAAHELPRHADEVWSVRFTPDGTAVVSTSFDNTARLTRADGRVSPVVFEGHHTSVYRGVLDRSGRWLATSSYDTDVRIWDLQRGSLATALPGHTASAFSVEVDATGERAVTASHDGTARVWSLHDGAALALLDDGGAQARSALSHAVFSPAGDRVAAARMNGDVSLWRLEPLEARRLRGHAQPVFRVTFDRRGQRVASASEDGTARVWDVDTGALTMVARGHEGPLWSVLFDATDERLITGSSDATVRVWDLQTGEQLAVLRGHTAQINCVVESPDRSVWASGSDDGSARLWPADLHGDPIVIDGRGKSVWWIVFETDGPRVATIAHDGQVRIWNAHDGQLLDVLGTGEGTMWDAEFIAGDRLATASSDGVVRIWSLGVGDVAPLLLSGHAADVQSIAVGLGGNRLVSAADDGSVQLWRIDSSSTDVDSLVARLHAATRFCPSADQRQQQLGQTPAAARAAFEACLARSGE
jgi:WD40 repeat protein/predicted Ser/Thr protein kinase